MPTSFEPAGGQTFVLAAHWSSRHVTVPLPEIRLTNLGQGPEGITVAELTKLVLQAIEKSAIQASSSVVADLSKQAGEITKDLQKQATGTLDNATKGIGDLLKKKK